MSYESLMLLENPRRRRRGGRRSRNPIGVGAIKSYAQGIKPMDVVAGAGGLILANYIPGLVIKSTTLTTTNKLLKIGVSIATAFAGGFLAKRFLGHEAGQAAVVGGLAGSALMGITSFSTWKPLGSNMAITNYPITRTVRDATVVSPSFNRNDETVSIIQP